MSSALLEDRVKTFQNAVASTERMGVSEFARSKSWRKALPEVGCVEIVDRSGVVGYLLAPDYAAALSSRLTELEERIEHLQIAAMFGARANYGDLRTGEDLESHALDYFDKNADALIGALDDDR